MRMRRETTTRGQLLPGITGTGWIARKLGGGWVVEDNRRPRERKPPSNRAQACAKVSGLASYLRHPCRPGEVSGDTRRIYSSLMFETTRSPPAQL